MTGTATLIPPTRASARNNVRDRNPALAGANVGHRAVQHHAGIVDERVQTPQLGDRTRNCAGRLLLVSDVALQHQCGAAIATATTLSCQRGRLMAASHVGTVVDNYTDPATKAGPLITYLRTLGIDGTGADALPAVKGYDDSTGVGSPRDYIQMVGALP